MINIVFSSFTPFFLFIVPFRTSLLQFLPPYSFSISVISKCSTTRLKPVLKVA